MMEFCHSHLTHNIFNYRMRRFIFGLVYVRQIFLSFFRSLDTGSIGADHYARECTF